MKKALLVALLPLLAAAQPRFAGSAAIDRAIEEVVASGGAPGAVCLVGQPGRTLHFKAYGQRALVPAREPMTTDTIFDAASLTKVVATASSLMKLFEQGRFRLNDKVTDHLPGFQNGHSDITLRQLLTHFSGLRPDLDLDPEWSGYQTGIGRALVDKPSIPRGERMIYSDINFILLGELVRVLSGRPLDRYAQDEIFRPLGMTESTFNPPAAWRPRIAPTEVVKGEVLRGVVHDPTARFMGGVAGHAGLFTTARDLARFAEFMLNLGELDGHRVVAPLTVRKFTEPQTPPHQATLRGLGWDIDSPYSTNRGELFPIGSYGHTGFTGTSLWIDPATKTYVILLANSVHPKRTSAMIALRTKVATIAAAGVDLDVQGSVLSGFHELQPARAVARNARVLTGLDVLVEEKFARLKGKRVGLITNHTGLTRDLRRNIDVMLASGVNLTTLFSPEHGLAGKLDQPDVANSRDEKTGLPVWSLHLGEKFKPEQSKLANVDVLVYDIQDVGARFYTYLSTMKLAMEAAAEAHIGFVVLDRPNPITGEHVEGPLLDAENISFVGCFPLPLRHAMTLGELARLLNAEARLGARLEVVEMKNWRRADWWDSTTLPWIDPSPNMRSPNAALLYPGVAMLEYARNYSVGRGTDAPFEQIGADWIRGAELAEFLNRRLVPGVRFYPTRFTPSASNFKDRLIEGVRIVVTDREGFSSLRLGLEIAYALEKLYPGRMDYGLNRRLIGSNAALEALRRAEDPRSHEERIAASLEGFRAERLRHLLYK